MKHTYFSNNQRKIRNYKTYGCNYDPTLDVLASCNNPSCVGMVLENLQTSSPVVFFSASPVGCAGEVHAMHPSVAELHVFVDSQREAAAASLQRQRLALLEELEALVQGCTAQQAVLLQGVWQRCHPDDRTNQGVASAGLKPDRDGLT